MNKRLLETYSTWSKENLENQIEVSLKALGINSETDIKDAKQVGDVTIIDGDDTSYPADLFGKRREMINLVKSEGYQHVIEEFAYTWFNRIVALRFMEVHGFLSHGFRVLSNPNGGVEPEILQNLNLVKDELRLDMDVVQELKSQGKIEELFRYVLMKQCDALADILPMLFSESMGYLELLLPKTLLKGDTVVTKLLDIPEEDFLEDVEIIGWMYQFYISSKKDAVYASKKTITKDTLPAVTQLFTPDWIVRYMAENSVGRLWLESYPDSPLRSEMKYYVEDAEQTEEVKKKIEEIRYKNVNPEEIRIIEPCCGSGHILSYVFDLLFKMYEERGYQKRDIPTLILKNNLTGLDVDKRAVQLSSFALVMKARSANNRFFDKKYYEAPHVYEIQDSKLLIDLKYRKHLKDLNLLSADEIAMIDHLVDDFKNGKTIGSLLKIEAFDYVLLDMTLEKIEKTAEPSLFNTDFLDSGMKRLKELSVLVKVLSAQYDVMITNPPYRPVSSMEAPVIDYAINYYPNTKSDMYAMFMETGFVKLYGFQAMINMHSWMFLSDFKKLRKSLLPESTTVNLLHLGARAFEEIGGEVVQTVSFVIRNISCPQYKSVYCRLVDAQSKQEKEKLFLLGVNRYISSHQNFMDIPDEIFAYWISERYFNILTKATKLESFGNAKQGLATTDNKRFLRLWYEINFKDIDFTCHSCDEIEERGTKWFPYNKAGSYRKWSSINEYVVNYESNGRDIKKSVMQKYTYLKSPDFVVKNTDSYFKKGITWNDVSTRPFCCRYVPEGYIYDAAGPMFFSHSDMLMLAYFNSVVFQSFANIICQGLHYSTGHIPRIPYIRIENGKTAEIAENLSKTNLKLSTRDWDSFETSWNFKYHPLVVSANMNQEKESPHFTESEIVKHGLLSWHFNKWVKDCQERFDHLKANEEELNRIFIDIYGLQYELTPEVEDKAITVRLAEKKRDIKSLISYLIGIEMGRYSLDVGGLAYAGGDWDESKYQTYEPDEDGIVPIYTKLGMDDGLTTKIIGLIKLIYGDDTYRQNIDFIAEALGKKNSESSEETLNRYLNDGFYKDHLKIYQKRPIYWLFTSGKKAGFKCLIYMHRYNEDTLARINSKYYLPESTRKKNELEELLTSISRAEGREKIRLEKERQKLAESYNEAIEYGQVLDHMANQYISIDLDDGVKVNYAKFQGVEFVTDSGTKVKKDLLAPLK